MTLKEKFTEMVLDKDIAEWEKDCEKIADEFAIGFAEWLNGLDINDYVLQKHISSQELLEIYKKEKGL